MIPKSYCITGAPRSGTKTMALKYQEQGADVQHERMGSDGISSWFFFRRHDRTFDTHQRPPEDFVFNERILVVRDPLKTIESLSQLTAVDNFRRIMCDLGAMTWTDPLTGAMRTWSIIYDQAECDVTIRIEDTDVPDRHNHLDRYKLTWSDLVNCNRALANKVAKLAHGFNYKLPSNLAF